METYHRHCVFLLGHCLFRYISTMWSWKSMTTWYSTAVPMMSADTAKMDDETYPSAISRSESSVSSWLFFCVCHRVRKCIITVNNVILRYQWLSWPTWLVTLRDFRTSNKQTSRLILDCERYSYTQAPFCSYDGVCRLHDATSDRRSLTLPILQVCFNAPSAWSSQTIMDSMLGVWEDFVLEYHSRSLRFDPAHVVGVLFAMRWSNHRGDTVSNQSTFWQWKAVFTFVFFTRNSVSTSLSCFWVCTPPQIALCKAVTKAAERTTHARINQARSK